DTVHVPAAWSDDRRVAVSMQIFPLANAAGAIEYVAATYQDETEAMLAMAEDLRITLDSIGDAVMATDGSGRITRMNPVAEHLTGWKLDEARGKPLSEVFHIVNEDTGELVESPVDRVMREGVVVGLANHTILIARDGTQRAIADSGAPIFDARG